MNDEQGFLDQIQANPADPFLRLVYADWLEDRGDARSEYLRVDIELQKRMASLTPYDMEHDPQVRELRTRLKQLGKGLDAAWLGIFDTLRPRVYRCRTCHKYLAPQDAIDTNPRNHKKMKSTRYCRLCYEDAVRNQLRQSFESRYGSSDRDYRGYRGFDE